MDHDHLDAVTTLAAHNWRILANPDTCPRIRAAATQIDDVLEAIQNLYAGDLAEIAGQPETETPPRASTGVSRDWILLSGRKRRLGLFEAARH